MRNISIFHLILKYSIVVITLYEIKTIEPIWTEEHGNNVELKSAMHKRDSPGHRRGTDFPLKKHRKQGFLLLFPQVKTSSKQKMHRRDLLDDLASIQERLATITAEPIKRIPSSIRQEETEHKTEHTTRVTKKHTATENQIRFSSSQRPSMESSTRSPDSPENVIPAILQEALSKEDGDRARAAQKGNANRKNDDQRLEKDRSSYGTSLGHVAGHVAGQSALQGQEHDLCGKNCSEPCPKSIDQVYALSVRGERRYDAAAAGGSGGRVTVAELSAELLSEVERVEQGGGAGEEGEPAPHTPPPAEAWQPTRRATVSTAGGPAPAWATRDSTTAAAASRSSPKRSVADETADAADNLADEDDDNVLPLVVNGRPMFGRPSLH